jgi:hypothetical protein
MRCRHHLLVKREERNGSCASAPGQPRDDGEETGAIRCHKSGLPVSTCLYRTPTVLHRRHQGELGILSVCTGWGSEEEEGARRDRHSPAGLSSSSKILRSSCALPDPVRGSTGIFSTATLTLKLISMSSIPFPSPLFLSSLSHLAPASGLPRSHPLPSLCSRLFLFLASSPAWDNLFHAVYQGRVH